METFAFLLMLGALFAPMLAVAVIFGIVGNYHDYLNKHNLEP